MKPIKKKKKAAWIRYIHRRISLNKNFLGMCSGKTGSGKSYSILRICEELNDDFSVDRVVFRAKDLMKIVNDPKYKDRKGVAILWDEAGIDLNNKNWQSRINKVLNYLIQTFRHRNFILFFTSPHSDFIDSATRKMFHAQFETLSIDKNKKVVILKPLQIDYNAEMKKYYRKYLIAKEGKIMRWEIPMPSDSLIEAYEKKKNEFTALLNKDILDELTESEPELVVEQETTNEGEIINGVLMWKGQRIRHPEFLSIIQCWKEGITDIDKICERTRIKKNTVNVFVGKLRKKFDIYDADFLPDHIKKEKNPIFFEMQNTKKTELAPVPI
jgi:hypothetical protein